MWTYEYVLCSEPMNCRNFVRSNTSNDTPQPSLRRPHGRRRIGWLHQVCADLNLPVSNAFNLAPDWTSWRAVATTSKLCEYASHDDDDDEILRVLQNYSKALPLTTCKCFRIEYQWRIKTGELRGASLPIGLGIFFSKSRLFPYKRHIVRCLHLR